jgi:hypothetical protein
MSVVTFSSSIFVMRPHRIFLPRTLLNLDLAKPDAAHSIHLWSQTDVRWHLWTFEQPGEADSSDSIPSQPRLTSFFQA